MSDLKDQLEQLANRHRLTEKAVQEIEVLLEQSTSTMLPPSQPESRFAGDTTIDLNDQTVLLDVAALHEPPKKERGEQIGRYEQRAVLGHGGMGEVFRVWDPILGRHVALKLIRQDRVGDARIRKRFIEEARLTAQLEHPGIVSVHALEQTSDGRALFTMPEFQGKTLRSVIRDLHPRDSPEAVTAIRRMLVSFLRACQAVAYAHDRGVIHRDIKPSNIMFGTFGEVLVLDWGLACRIGSDLGEKNVAGTPRYMSPEQAHMHPPSPADDVYALGATLVELITGTPPFPGVRSREILRRVRSGSRIHIPPMPPGLQDLAGICHAALAPLRVRLPNAGALSALLSAWLDGSQAHERAQGMIADADALFPTIQRHHRQAMRLEERARLLQRQVPAYAPIDEKKPLWEIQDAARDAHHEARQAEKRYMRLLQSALQESPLLEDAHRRLADHYRRKHEAAEQRGDTEAAERLESRLRTHDHGRHAEWLQGDGRLTLHTAPTGASVTAYRYVEVDRRLQLQEVGPLGQTPIESHRMPRGRYLLVIEHEGFETVRYPVFIERNKHWNGIPPGEEASLPVPLPPVGELAEDECYVPPGWFTFGGDREALLPRTATRVWVDGFVMKRHPVTNTEYLAFVNEPGTDRSYWAPRERPGPTGEPGPLLVGQDSSGKFILVMDADGDLWTGQMPVTYTDWAAAREYAGWYAKKTGKGWRLPLELEWEKAARGVDRRLFPWGDFADPTWCQCRDAGPGRQVTCEIERFPTDESPYGVRGMAGNVMDWCLDPYDPDGPAIVGSRAVMPPPSDDVRRIMRGGFWFRDINHARCCNRTSMVSTGRDGGRGFRLTRPWPPREE